MKKVIIIMSVLLLVGGIGFGVWFKMRRKGESEGAGASTAGGGTATLNPIFKDSAGNSFELTNLPYSDPKAGYWIIVNGQMNGGLTKLYLGTDGYAHGQNGYGAHFSYRDGFWVGM